MLIWNQVTIWTNTSKKACTKLKHLRSLPPGATCNVISISSNKDQRQNSMLKVIRWAQPPSFVTSDSNLFQSSNQLHQMLRLTLTTFWIWWMADGAQKRCRVVLLKSELNKIGYITNMTIKLIGMVWNIAHLVSARLTKIRESNRYQRTIELLLATQALFNPVGPLLLKTILLKAKVKLTKKL